MYQKNDTQKRHLFLDVIKEVDEYFMHFNLICIYEDFFIDINRLYQTKNHL